MPYNDRPKAPLPTHDAQRRVLDLLSPAYTAPQIAELLGLPDQYVARDAIGALRRLTFNIENDRETNTFRFRPVPHRGQPSE